MAASVHQIHQGLPMPSERGYVSLWRDIDKQPWYKNQKRVVLFIHLLIKASHKPCDVVYRGRKITLLPGQIAKTNSQLAFETGLEKIDVQRGLAQFKKLGQITTNADPKFTIISLSNWAKFNAKSDTVSDTLFDTRKAAPVQGIHGSSDTASDTVSDTQNNNVYNNNKIVSKDTYQNSGEFSPATPAKKMDVTPHQEIINLFAEHFPSLPQPKKLTANRRKVVKARHVNDMKSDLNNWRKYFSYIVSNCQWMISGKYNVDFDYITRESTFIKVMEGAKDDRK